jgi:hypothetical protein
LALTASLAFVAPRTLLGQATSLPTGIGIATTAGHFTMNGEGEAFLTDVGPGVDGYLRFTIWRVAANAVFHYSRHDAVAENQANYALYFEPWYVVRLAPSRVSLFVGPRIGWTRLILPCCDDPDYAIEWDGIAVGGTGGVLVQLVGPLAVQAQASFTASWYGNAESAAVGSFEDSEANGSSLGLQIGLALTIPWD